MTSDRIAGAREALRNVTPPRGARERVLSAVLFRPRREAPKLTVAVALLLVLVASSAAAFGLAVASRLGLLRRADAPRAAPAGQTPQASPRRPAARATAPATASQAAPAAPELAPEVALPPALEAAPRVAVNTPRQASPVKADSDSLLSLQVAAYKEASALVAVDPGAAVTRLQAFRRRYPTSSLLPEVQLRLIQALGKLARTDDARREARAFLARYPASSRRAELEALVGEPEAPPSTELEEQ
ncbi:MAG TPA: outer membrane protein assembly factor BamD [Polyangiaceae bacterium]